MGVDWRSSSKEPEREEAAGVNEEAAQAEAVGVDPMREMQGVEEKLQIPQAREESQGRTMRGRATATTAVKKDTGQGSAQI